MKFPSFTIFIRVCLGGDSEIGSTGEELRDRGAGALSSSDSEEWREESGEEERGERSRGSKRL